MVQVHRTIFTVVHRPAVYLLFYVLICWSLNVPIEPSSDSTRDAMIPTNSLFPFLPGIWDHSTTVPVPPKI